MAEVTELDDVEATPVASKGARGTVETEDVTVSEKPDYDGSRVVEVGAVAARVSKETIRVNMRSGGTPVDDAKGGAKGDAKEPAKSEVVELEDIVGFDSVETKALVESIRQAGLLMNVDTHITLDSVILSPENKSKILDFVKETQNREKLMKYGLTPMNRLLFYGASGCGKTFLGKALSNHLGYTMLYISISQALAKGNVASNLDLIFRLANRGEYIVFLDECDSIAWNRDADDAEGGDIRRATNSLFQYMDQMNPRTIIICATNMLKRLDPAFARRFNMKLQFEKPKTTDLEATIRKFLKPGFQLLIDKKDRITESRAKLSYYELQDTLERVMKKAVLSDTLNVRMSDIYKDIAKQCNFKIHANVVDDEEAE